MIYVKEMLFYFRFLRDNIMIYAEILQKVLRSSFNFVIIDTFSTNTEATFSLSAMEWLHFGPNPGASAKNEISKLQLKCLLTLDAICKKAGRKLKSSINDAMYAN